MSNRAGQQDWTKLRAYHRLVIMVLMAMVWGLIGLSATHFFLYSSHDPTRSGWQPANAAGAGPQPLDHKAADGSDVDLTLLSSWLENLDGGGNLSGAQRNTLEKRLQRALLRLGQADVLAKDDGRGGVFGDERRGERPSRAALAEEAVASDEAVQPAQDPERVAASRSAATSLDGAADEDVGTWDRRNTRGKAGAERASAQRGRPGESEAAATESAREAERDVALAKADLEEAAEGEEGLEEEAVGGGGEGEDAVQEGEAEEGEMPQY